MRIVAELPETRGPGLLTTGRMSGRTSPTVPPLALNGARASSPRPHSARRSATPPGRKAPLSLSSSKRASSAGREKKPESPLTPRQKKATRSLFKELGQAVDNTNHMITRVERTRAIVIGTIREMQSSQESACSSLEKNSRMYAATKETGPKPAKVSMTARPLNALEMEDVLERLRGRLDEAGEERFPSQDEIDDEVAEVQKRRAFDSAIHRNRAAKCNTPIVEALEALQVSARASGNALIPHGEGLAKHIEFLKEIRDALVEHRDMRDEIFDEKRSACCKDIDKAVLYQKCNPMKPMVDRTGQPMELDDKNMESSKGKGSTLVHIVGAPEPRTETITAHDATGKAASREDLARDACNRAVRAVRDARSEIATRKSKLQISVATSRQMVLTARRAAKSGKFGSSEERNTDPATRKTASNPEDTQ